MKKKAGLIPIPKAVTRSKLNEYVRALELALAHYNVIAASTIHFAGFDAPAELIEAKTNADKAFSHGLKLRGIK